MRSEKTKARRGVIGLALSLLVAGGVSASAADFTWHGKVAAGKGVEVEGLNGRIRATLSAGDEVTVTASKHGTKSDPAEVDVRLVEHGDGVTICSVYPAPAGRTTNECAPGEGGRMGTDNNDVAVDYEIGIPKGVRFKAHNVNGSIEAEGMTAAVDVRTVNGALRLTTAGAVVGKTVNGAIDVTVNGLGGDVRLETVNGAATLALPASVNASIEGQTVHGVIASDFPWSIEGHHVGKHVRGSLGSGGPVISVRSVNGALTFRKR